MWQPYAARWSPRWVRKPSVGSQRLSRITRFPMERHLSLGQQSSNRARSMSTVREGEWPCERSHSPSRIRAMEGRLVQTVKAQEDWGAHAHRGVPGEGGRHPHREVAWQENQSLSTIGRYPRVRVTWNVVWEPKWGKEGNYAKKEVSDSKWETCA